MKIKAILFLSFIGGFCIFSQGAFKVTIVYDNYVHTRGTQSDWGFSCLVECGEETILFDTGTKPHILAKNAEKLGIDLQKIKKVVISHNHGDHFGGLSAVLRGNKGVTVYIPPNLQSGTLMDIAASGGTAVRLNEPKELGAGIMTTGIMGNRIPEQGLILQTGTRNILITGCAHPGIVEMIEKAGKLTGKKIDVVFGGFHLNSHSASEIRKIIADFRRLGVKQAGPTHCSGNSAIAAFREAYGQDFLGMGVGRVIDLQ